MILIQLNKNVMFGPVGRIRTGSRRNDNTT